MKKSPKRPKDINKLARFVVELATGEKMPAKKSIAKKAKVPSPKKKKK